MAELVDHETMTTAEAALRLSVSVRTVRSMIASGALEATRDGQRWLIAHRAVQSELERRLSSGEEVVLDLRDHVSAGEEVVAAAAPEPSHAVGDRVEGDRALVATPTLVGLIVAVALLLILCSSLVARTYLSSRGVVAGPTAQWRPVGTNDSIAATSNWANVVVMLAGAGILLGAQLIAFTPKLVRSLRAS